MIAQIKGLIPDYLQDEITVEELFYDEPSYTGFVFPVSKYYPAWLLEDTHPLVQAGQQTVQELWGEDAAARHVGLLDQRHLLGRQGEDPGHRLRARAMRRPRTCSHENVPLDDVVRAAEFYALLPKMLAEEPPPIDGAVVTCQRRRKVPRFPIAAGFIGVMSLKGGDFKNA